MLFFVLFLSKLKLKFLTFTTVSLPNGFHSEPFIHLLPLHQFQFTPSKPLTCEVIAVMTS